MKFRSTDVIGHATASKINNKVTFELLLHQRRREITQTTHIQNWKTQPCSEFENGERSKKPA